MSAGPATQRPLRAIVIGTSAGGVEALSKLLPSLSPDCGVSIFVVLHLPRERPSLLADIFGPKCALPVVEAQDKQPIEPEVIYFAPPDYHLLIDEGPQLALSSDEPVHYSRPSVDVLFESAADEFGAALLGIVLSGANQDGAAGLRRIAQAGGFTMVQLPETAIATAMPEAALAAAPHSARLSLDELADALRNLRHGLLEARSNP